LSSLSGSIHFKGGKEPRPLDQETQTLLMEAPM
jgi:hypothetical protein